MEILETVGDLELRNNNPYSIGEILTLGDESLLQRMPLSYSRSPLDRLYEISDGDTLLNIAFEAWGDSKNWWIIYDVNNIHNPFELEVGTYLIIPDLGQLQIENS